MIHFHWPTISGHYVLSTSKRSVHHHGPCYSDYRLDGKLCLLILMWGTSPTKHYLFLFLQKLLHKLWGIEYPIISVASLDNHSLTLSLPLKCEFFLYSFSIVYDRLMLNIHITTGIVNKNTSSWEHIKRILIYLCVVEPTWRPLDIVICRYHIYRQKMILLEIFLLHRIILDCIHFLVYKIKIP